MSFRFQQRPRQWKTLNIIPAFIEAYRRSRNQNVVFIIL